ncbi:MAG: hypothetical protein NTV80_10525 [Verrucomicrobia bacterium]|nr:hypothetical protein [Verrucomicrobiota bacterium]
MKKFYLYLLGPLVTSCLQISCTSRCSDSIQDDKNQYSQALGKTKLQSSKVVISEEPTPALKKYMKVCTSRVGARWHELIRSNLDVLELGRVRFQFYVDKNGIPHELKILKGTNPLLQELTKRAIIESSLPPIPADLLPDLDDEQVKIEYEAIVY